MTTQNNDFNLPKEGYIAFDATSLRQLIVDRLNKQEVFTDQNFVGSNLAAVIDIISYAYHTLIYYLNKTSSESMFSEAQLYENVNRIVKLIDYSPIGYQTSTLSFDCSANNLIQGLYTIPRYTFGLINNIPYSFNEDIFFTKQENNTLENLNQLAQQKLFYQGIYQEYPTYRAAGDDNEIVILNPNDDIVDHFNIDVYVKSKTTNKWEQYRRTANLYLENGSSKVYEVRLNENSRYEIKFGNNINGLKLQTDDQVAIYYLASQGELGVIGSFALNRSNFLRPYSTIRYNEILNDLFTTTQRFLTPGELSQLLFTNTLDSTLPKLPETSAEIKNTAPANYRSQNRLVTTQDFEVFIKTNFANLLLDVKCINNWEYVSGYLKYFYDLGLTQPTKIDQPLFNQLQYADACNFNNLYLLIVPRTTSTSINYLLPAQKQLINSSLLENKMATVETVFLDPIYKAVSIGITNDILNFDPLVEQELTKIQIIKNPLSRRNDQSIINDVINIFENYFTDNQFGQNIDVRLLIQEVLGIEGVQNIFTYRTDEPSIRTQNISFFVYNPSYPDIDRTSTTTNVFLNNFEYMYFADFQNLASKIEIVSTIETFETTEY